MRGKLSGYQPDMNNRAHRKTECAHVSSSWCASTCEIMIINQRITRKQYLLLGSISFFVCFIVWSGLSYGQIVKSYFLPTPGQIIQALSDLFVKYDLWGDIRISFLRVMIGFTLAACIAIPLGALMGTYKTIEALIEPLNDFIRYMPVPAFIPLAILWVGLGTPSQITIIFIGTFFQLVVMVMDVVANVPKQYLEVAYTLGLRDSQVFWRVILRSALPGIYDSLRVSVGWAWSYLVLAEVVAADKGVGHMIMEGQRYLRTDNVIAGIIVIGLLGISIDYVFKLIYPRLFPWARKIAA